MLDLERAIADEYYGYVTDLGRAIEQLQPWWQRLESIHERAQLRRRWPAGIASHPRVLAIVRDYHARFEIAAKTLPPGPPPRFDDDTAWGSESEAAPRSLIPVAPARLLIDRLQIEAPELYEKLVFLVMLPIGTPPQPKPSLRSLQVIEPDPRRAQAFSFAGQHGTARGVARLLGAASDVRVEPVAAIGLREASEFHRLAHFAYLRDLERALIEAERWWTAELASREARGLSADEAVADGYRANLVGPVAHPRVLGVIQAYWALCEEINAVLRTTEQPVAPEQLLLDWLRDGHRESWVDTLAAMPYWPIGVDERGRWS
jgi:hypothetical protein